MRALSIIGIVASVFSVLMSIAVMNITCYCFTPDKDYFKSLENVGEMPGFTILILSLFFLAFSIVATINSFKKNKV